MNCFSEFLTRQTKSARRIFVSLLTLASCLPITTGAVQSISLAWDSSPDTNVVNYNIYYGPASGNYTNVVTAGNTNNATVTGLFEGSTYFFVATAVDAVGLESDPSNEISYSVPTGTNQPPTIDLVGAITISENAPTQVITLTGITSGAGDPAQTLTVTSVSSDTTLIPDPVVTYASPASTATLSFKPVTDAFGSADISVTVSDSSLSTQIVFHVTVNQVAPIVTFPSPKGAFNGLFYEPDEIRQTSAGFFSVTVTSSGAYSGRVQLGAKKYSFHGLFDSQGTATNTILRGLDPSLQVELHLGAGSLTNQIMGTVTDGTWASSLSGERAVFNTRSNPSPQAGIYTMRLPGVAGAPPTIGDGFATLRITPAGTVKLAGALPDGTRMSLGSTISSSGLLPVYVALYKGKGALVSWLSITNPGGGSLGGLGTWTKPTDATAHYYSSGLTNDFMIAGLGFHPPAVTGQPLINLSSAVVSFSGGNLGPGFSNQITIATNGKVANLSSNRLTLSFAGSSGLFTGNVADPVTGKIMPFKGALLQGANAGYGFLSGTNRTSAVLISQ